MVASPLPLPSEFRGEMQLGNVGRGKGKQSSQRKKFLEQGRKPTISVYPRRHNTSCE